MKFKSIIVFFKITLFILIFFFIINFISGYFSERVNLYVRQKATLEANDLINNTIEKEVLPNIDINNLVKINKNPEGEVESVFINTYQVNKILGAASNAIKEELDKFENRDLQELSLPLGIVISDTLFSDVGPNIKIKIRPVGTIQGDVITTNEEYGINNTLLQISVIVVVDFITIIPFQKETIRAESIIPIVVQMIQGRVPTYYYTNVNGEFIPHPIS